MLVTLEDIGATILSIREFAGAAEEFKLRVPDEMNDPVGVNMAIILDEVLAKNWVPDGFRQEDGYRIYEYCAN